MRGIVVILIILAVLIGGAILLSRSVSEQPTRTIEIPVTPAGAAQ